MLYSSLSIYTTTLTFYNCPSVWHSMNTSLWQVLSSCLIYSYSINLKNLTETSVCQSLSCVRLCDSTHCSSLGFSVHGILPGKNTGMGCISFSRGPSWPRDQTRVSCIVGRFFTIWAISLESPITFLTSLFQ